MAAIWNEPQVICGLFLYGEDSKTLLIPRSVFLQGELDAF